MSQRNPRNPARPADYDDPLGPAKLNSPADEPAFWPEMEHAKPSRPSGRAKPQVAGRAPAAPLTRRHRSTGRPPTLVEAAEPLFSLICRLNRAARKGQAPANAQVVRGQIRSAFAEVRKSYVEGHGSDERASQHAERQWIKAVRPLVYFTDYQIRNSALPFAFDWHDIAEEDFDELAGDEQFFKVFEADVAKDTPTAIERLALYHECLGLGFAGMYALEPAAVPEYMRQARARIAAKLGKEAFDRFDSRLTQQAYEQTDDSELPPERTSRLLSYVAVAAVVVCLLMIGLTFYVYRSQTGEYVNALDRLSPPATAEPRN